MITREAAARVPAREAGRVVNLTVEAGAMQGLVLTLAAIPDPAAGKCELRGSALGFSRSIRATKAELEQIRDLAAWALEELGQ